MSAHGTQAVDRAALLLGMVVQADRPITFTELAEESGLARSTTSRLLAALERTHLLERDEAGAFVPGALFALHSLRHDPWTGVVRLARPALRRLVEETGETVNLGVARGDTVVQIAQESSRYVLGARDWVGVDVPPHCSALGKVMYAFQGLPLPRRELETPTPHSIRTREELDEELQRVRRAGYACTREELEVGLSGVAAPVYGRAGTPLAALGVSGPTARLAGHEDKIGRLLVRHATNLSELLRSRLPKEGAA